MCGIAGSSNKQKAFELYQSNLDRGYYSSGALVINDLSLSSVSKKEGQFVKPVEPPDPPQIHVEGLYYLYHSRGPTTETVSFLEKDNHPFYCNSWYVAHNGIISNFEQLKQEHFSDEYFESTTDSSIIPKLINKYGLEKGINFLEGTFAVWIFNITTNKTYIARNSCTLYANTETGDFSSTKFKDSVLLDEHTLYEIKDYKEINILSNFTSKSHYFIL